MQGTNPHEQPQHDGSPTPNPKISSRANQNFFLPMKASVILNTPYVQFLIFLVNICI
jgi:hypothetical protein